MPSQRKVAVRTKTATPKAEPPSRRLRRSNEIRERLFRSALALFAVKGFPNTTVEDMSSVPSCGLSPHLQYG